MQCIDPRLSSTFNIRTVVRISWNPTMLQLIVFIDFCVHNCWFHSRLNLCKWKRLTNIFIEPKTVRYHFLKVKITLSTTLRFKSRLRHAIVISYEHLSVISYKQSSV